MPSLDSLDALLEAELKDIYDAEKQITKALPKIMKKATTAELKQAIEEHLRQSEQHIERLEQAFEQLQLTARGKKCVGMQNLLKEGDEMMRDAEDKDTRDAVIIAAAQKVEHYEIAAYGTLRTWANLLGHTEVAALFEETLDEEKETDQRLTTIAEQSVNRAASDNDEAGEDDEKDQGDEESESSGMTTAGAGRRSRAGAASTGQVAADRGGRGRGAASGSSGASGSSRGATGSANRSGRGSGAGRPRTR